MIGSGKIGTVLLIGLTAGGLAASNRADSSKPEEWPLAATTLNQTESVLGKNVVSRTGESAGRIVDVLADTSGRVRAAVVDFGGFLGVGSRSVAVAWADLHFGPDGNTGAVTVDISPDRLSQAPEVKPGKPVVVVSGHDIAGNRAARK